MKKGFVIILSLLAVSAIGYYFFSPELREQRMIEQLIAKNIKARGGMAAWAKVNSMVTVGKMDVGHGVHLSYKLEQLRPNKMCLSYQFKSRENYQCTDGKVGWKSLPFKGRSETELLTENELKEFSGTAEPYGLLFNPEQRGITIRYQGAVELDGQTAHKLELTTRLGAQRTLYLDETSGLEVKMESIRTLRGKPRLVETWYKDWKATDGLLFAQRVESKTEGDSESHFVTLESIQVNGVIPDDRFLMPGNQNVASVR